MTEAATIAGTRILLIDDDLDTREMYEVALSHLGADVVTAPTTRDGFDIFRRARPDVVVSDITLEEEGDGYELVRAIRALEPGEGGTVPTIALTGWAGAEARDEARDAGFDEHCPKPCTPNDLALVISRMLRAECRASRSEAMEIRLKAGEVRLQAQANRMQIREEFAKRRAEADAERSDPNA